MVETRGWGNRTFECLKLGDLGLVDCADCTEGASTLEKSQGVRHDV